MRTCPMTRYKHGDAERRDTHPLHRNLLKAGINLRLGGELRSAEGVRFGLAGRQALGRYRR
ncbi:hypothetical protein SBA4_2120014 [Candidatus Sulfopaludibacter sp. SbA4]|nr:hypothetical protein SBA4_2120014 [Candidatus Sulfopaludibacter sp. SbA4]